MFSARIHWAAFALLLPVHLLVFGANFFSPYDPALQNRALPFAPPTRLHFVDADGKWHVRPFVYALVPVADRFAVYTPETKRAFAVHFFVRDRKSVV